MWFFIDPGGKGWCGVVGALKVGDDVVELGEAANVKYEGVEAAGGRAEDWKAAGRRMMF
ncbi:hypothetical protein Hanom_Chr12g01125161 [Helianthus anomalus]